jgi:DNA-binding PadR family transcriptional regulator
MVRLEIPKRPDTREMDILRVVSRPSCKGGNYPLAIHKQLQSYYGKYHKNVDDQTVTMTLERLRSGEFLYAKKDKGKKYYFLTPKGEALLASTLVVDYSSGQTSVYVGRIDGNPLPRRFAVASSNRTEISVRNLKYNLGCGSVSFPLPDDAVTVDICVKGGGFARIEFDGDYITKYECEGYPKDAASYSGRLLGYKRTDHCE